jgi:hypothetical protein
MRAARSRAQATPLVYETLLGADTWRSLPSPVRAVHSPGRARGRLTVRRGAGPVARLVGALCRFPPAATDAPVMLCVSADGGRMTWERRIDSRSLITAQTVEGARLHEQLGLIVCAFELLARDGGIDFLQRSAALALGSWRARLPRWLAPRVRGRAQAAGAGVEVDVEISAPLVGLVLGYRGFVTPAEAGEGVP